MSVTKIHTFCRICEPQCGLVAEVEDGKIISLLNDPDHPAHKGYSCHKGIRYLRVHDDPDRLSYPLRRLNSRSEDQGAFAAIGWDDAVREIAEKLNSIVRRHGDRAIAIYMGNPHAFNSTLITNEVQLMAGFGDGPRFGAYTIDCANKIAASEGIFGTAMVHPIPDLLHTHYFLSIGNNPAVSHMAIMEVADPMEKLRAIKRRGGKTVFINPRIIESATPATGEVVLIKPDTDFFLLAALLHEIIFGIGVDRRHIDAHSRNFDKLEAFIKAWPVERAAAVTGIPRETIREIAREFATAPSACINMSTGVNMGSQGLLAYWLVQMLSLVTGNLGRRGGNFYSPAICPTAQHTMPATDDPFFETEFGKMRTTGGQLPSNMMADFLESSVNPVKALIVISGNPVLAVGGEQRTRAALEGLELMVCIDLYRSATGELADYLLPAKDFLEREDVSILGNGHQLEPHVQYTPAVVAPAGERRDDWWILARILQAMGRPSLLDEEDPNPFATIEGMLQYRGLDIEKLNALPCQTAILPDAVPEDLFRFGVQHPDGLIDCAPALIERAYASAERCFDDLIGEPADQLKLITRRTALTVNSWLANLPEHKKGVHMTNPLWINPTDAADRGLIAGMTVTVQSDFGAITADLMVDDTLMRGVVSMTHGWGHSQSYGLSTARRFPGSNVNRLAPSGAGSFDPLTNQARLTALNVTVTAFD